MSLTLFRNIRVFDGERTFQGSVVVGDDVITSVLDSHEVRPVGRMLTVVEGEGLTLLPGLIDSHVHAHIRPGKCAKVLEPALTNGITTLLDMHNNPDVVRNLKEVCSNSRSLPDLRSACYAATIDGGWPKPIVLHHDHSEQNKQDVASWPSITPDSAEEFVKRNKEQGADYIKLMQENGFSVAFPGVAAASFELQKAVTSAAHRHGLLAVAHATNMVETMLLLRAGVDGLMHTFADRIPSPELVQLYQETGAFVVPTLTVIASLTGEERHTSAMFASGDDETKAIMCDALDHKGPGVKVENAYASVRELKAVGIDIVAGTDAVPGMKGTAIGPSLLEELYLYVERCGFTPTEALKSATSVAARRFKLEDRGRIEAGKRADLLLIKGDPTHDIEDLRHIEGVWKAGIRCV